MTPLPKPSDVAKQNCVDEKCGIRNYVCDRCRLITEIIPADRSRLVAYIREKMPKQMSPMEKIRGYDAAGDLYDSETQGWNSCIEAFERVLKEVEG